MKTYPSTAAARRHIDREFAKGPASCPTCPPLPATFREWADLTLEYCPTCGMLRHFPAPTPTKDATP